MNETTTPSPPRLFPSTLAAANYGAVGTPVLVIGWRFIEATFPHHAALALLWFLVAFIVPVMFTTGDLRYLARRVRERRSVFRPLSSPEDFRRFYRPAWKRMLVCFIACAVSMLTLTMLGIEF